MNGRFERFIVTERGMTRKPGSLSNNALVIWSSSCNGATWGRGLTSSGRIDSRLLEV